MSIELNGKKVWGSGYSFNNKTYGDPAWKEKIKSLVSNQDYVIVEGRYGKNNHDAHYNIKGFPFSVISKDDFLKMLDRITLGYTDDVYLYDAYENEKDIWSKKTEITERNRYIFISHTATEYQML